MKTDMTGKVVIITGASSGLGYHQAKNLLDSNATVIFACRNETKAKKAISDLPKEKQKNAIYMPLDLCSFKSIENFVKQIKEKFPNKIDILVNNAGAQPVNYLITEDNLESFIQGNHIGPMYLTFSLIDHINNMGRIINLSSLAHFVTSLNKNSTEILSDNQKIKDNYFKSMFGKFALYNDTKLMNLYFTSYLNDLFNKKGIEIKTCCLHPGVCDTGFFRYINDFKIMGILYNVFRPLVYLCFKNGEQGAQTQIYLSHLEYGKIMGGAYYADCKEHFKAPKGNNIELRNIIMNWSIKEITKRAKINEQYILKEIGI